MKENLLKELLYRSIDGLISDEEKEKLTKALKSDPELQNEKMRLEKMRTALSTLTFTEDSGFTDRVMEKVKIDGKELVTRKLNRLYLKIAAACALAILIALASIITGNGSFDLQSLTGLQDLSPDEAYSLLYK